MPVKYKSPELLPPDSLAKVTAEYKRANDERERRLSNGARVVLRTNAGLDEMQENARSEILALCDTAKWSDEQNDEPDLRLGFYAGFREAVREFCTALGSRPGDRRESAIERMNEAIASLDRYRGER